MMRERWRKEEKVGTEEEKEMKGTGERVRKRSRVVTVPPYREERGGRSRVATSTPPREAKQRSST